MMENLETSNDRHPFDADVLVELTKVIIGTVLEVKGKI